MLPAAPRDPYCSLTHNTQTKSLPKTSRSSSETSASAPSSTSAQSTSTHPLSTHEPPADQNSTRTEKLNAAKKRGESRAPSNATTTGFETEHYFHVSITGSHFEKFLLSQLSWWGYMYVVISPFMPALVSDERSL